MSDRTEPESSEINREVDPALDPGLVEVTENSAEASALFDLYERVVETQIGTRDAEIFEDIREWTFSDFSLPAHEFAGITKDELNAWQKRNRINLSSGHIRPDPIDLQRGYAWGQIRMTAHVNRLHSVTPPPSAHEIRLTWESAQAKSPSAA